ncbi:MAG: hypothetical protein HYY91_03155 [Candidatus Omnitrophica bacterium]|nr:hypothetical protein [Candidatus Omnitrophota bacterium]
MNRRIPLLLTALLIGFCGQAQAADDDFTLEGVVYETARPADSMAIINGAILKPGDAYHGHVVREIGEDFAVLQPETGGMPLRLRVWSAAPKPPPTPPSPGARAAPASRAAAETSSRLTESEQMAERAAAATQQSGAALPGGLNPFGMLNMAYEVQAMADVKRISTACAVLASMDETNAQGNVVPPTFTFERMKEMQMLPQAFEDHTGYYAYSVQPSAEGWGCEVHATPNNPNSGMRHFMVDQDGMMHAERDGPATMHSPRP